MSSNIAVVDEASVKITPDTSGFAAELRSELEAEIAAATAGLDDVIHIRVEVDHDGARAGLAGALDELQTDGTNAFRGLRDEERDLFDDIRVNTERTRDKVVLETTKTRDRVKQRLEPFWRWLKLKLTGTEKDFKKIKKAAEDAGKAATKEFTKAFGGSGKTLADAEESWSRARRAAENAAERLRVAEERLNAARDTAAGRAKALQDAEENRNRALDASEQATQRAREAEIDLEELRRDEASTAKEIEQAEQRFAKARADVDKANKALQQSENDLNKAREQSAAASEREVAADQKAAGIREQLVEANKRVTESQRDLARAHDESGQAARRSGTDHEQLGRIARFVRQDIGNLGTEVDKAGNILKRFGQGLDDAGKKGTLFGKITSIAGNAAKGFGNILSGITKLASNFGEGISEIGTGVKNLGSAIGSAVELLGSFGAALGKVVVIGGAVAFAVGAIGAAIAGLPALLSAAAAGFAVVALGMDGIKRAYESELKPALDQLKAQISQVFENGLKPQFRDLAQILIPAVTENLKQLAGAFVELSGRIVSVVTSAQGLNDIKGIIDKTTTAVRDLGPAVASLVQEFLALANTGTILQNMVGIVQDLATNVANWLAKMRETGDAERAVQALRTTLNNLEQTLLQVLGAATRFFTAAAPGFDGLVTSVGNVTSKLLDGLGPAFGRVMDAAKKMLDSVKDETWQQIIRSIDGVTQKLQHLADDPSFQRWVDKIAQGLARLTELFGGFITLLERVSEATDALDRGFSGLSDIIGQPDGMSDRVQRAGEDLGVFSSTAEQTVPPLNATGQAGTQMGSQVQRGALDGADAVGHLPPAADQAAQGTNQAIATIDFNPIINNAQAVFSQLPGVIQQKMQEAQTALVTAIQAMASNAKSSFDTMGTQLEQSMQQLTQKLVQKAQELNNQFSTQMNQLPIAAQRAIQQVTTVIQTGMQQVAQAVQQGADQVKTAADQMAQAIEQAADKMKTAMSTAATEVQNSLQQIAQAFQTNLQQARDTTQQNFDQILQKIQETMRQIVQAVQDGMRQLVEAIRTGGDDAKTAADEVADKIVEAFTSKADEMEQAGRTMMERLAAGITAGGQQAVQAAQQVASQIAGAFPRSPAKWGPLSGEGDPLRSGGKIMERLADGIERNSRLVASALRPILAATATALAASTSVGAEARSHLGSMLSNWGVSNSQPAGLPRIQGGTLRDSSPREGASTQAQAGAAPVSQAQELVAALRGMKIEFVPGTQGAMARFVNQGNTQLARR